MPSTDGPAGTRTAVSARQIAPDGTALAPYAGTASGLPQSALSRLHGSPGGTGRGSHDSGRLKQRR